MTSRSDRIVRAFCATPWAIMPEKLEAIVEFLTLRAAGTRFTAEEVQARIGDGRKDPAASPTGIAVLSLYGVISHRIEMVNDMSGPGGTSTEKFGQQFDAAMADPSISAIVLNVDSPGGSVAGVEELAAKIAAARGKKPIVAAVNSLAASAAYWIASAADEIAVTPSGLVGSIGVFTVHLDASAADEQAGLHFTVVSAGKYKTEGNEYEPLSEDARAAMQEMVDDYYGAFVRGVAKNRGVSAEDVRGGYGQGRVITSRKAVQMGMADRVATLEQVIAKLGGRAGATVRATTVSAPAQLAAAAGEVLRGIQVIDEPSHVAHWGAEAGVSAADNRFATPAGEAAEPSIILILDEAAPVAEELAMSEKTAAAQDAGAATESREDKLSRLAEMHPGLAARLPVWIRDKSTTVESVQQEIAAHYSTRAEATHIASPRPVVTGGVPNEAQRGFASVGEQLFAIIQAGRGAGIDVRLRHINAAAGINAAVSGMNEGVGSEGGFFIQPTLLPGVIDPVYNEDPILSRVTRIPIGSGTNGVKYNVIDETARTNGSRWGGIQMYWAPEGGTLTPSAPKMRQMALDLKKLIGLAYLTDELQMDAPAAESLLTRAFQAELSFMLGAAVFSGLGGGQPLGILNSGAVVSQAIEATQTIANTNQFIAANVAKMLARIPSSLWGDVIWLYNQELLPYLIQAVIGSSGAVPLFMAAGGLADRPNDTILGRAAFPSELCEAVGTPGDILAVVPSQYHMADKGGPQQATSMHVRFLNDEQTLRIVYRTDGAPVWRTSVTPYKGANARSPFVTLAVRS
jgi:HK97 family phage major capsid protein